MKQIIRNAFDERYEIRLANEDDVDDIYINKILPEKMKYNLQYTKSFSFGYDIKLMFKTVKEVFG